MLILCVPIPGNVCDMIIRCLRYRHSSGLGHVPGIMLLVVLKHTNALKPKAGKWLDVKKAVRKHISNLFFFAVSFSCMRWVGLAVDSDVRRFQYYFLDVLLLPTPTQPKGGR